MTAKEIERELGIPASTLYHLAARDEVPYEDVTKSWHKQRHYRFRLSDVEKALARRREGR